MENVKTIPIHALTSEAPRALRARLLRYLHVAIASVVGLIPPVFATLYAVVLYGRDHAIFNSGWMLGLVILFLVGLMFHSVAKCSSSYSLIGFAGFALAGFLPHGYGIALVLVGVTGLIGLSFAHGVYKALRSRQVLPDTCETHKALNPRCGTCHARSFCPYQPGGIADRYSR